MSSRERWNLLLIAPVSLALLVVFRVTRTWAARVGHPYDLEWMEGGILAHAWRLQQGLPVYPEPGPDFVPMVYPPGYYAVLAGLGTMLDLGHPLGRAVSVVGTLAACTALVWLAHRRLGQPLLGLIGAGVYLGTYEATGAFFDLVRPDALAVGLLAWSLALAAEESPRRQVGAGLLLFLGFLVKHNTAAYGLPVVLGLWAWRGRGAALRYGLAAAAPGLAATVALQAASDGNFLTYLLEVPASHPMVLERVMPGTVRELGGALAVACVALAGWAIALGPRVAPRLPPPAQLVPSLLAGGAAAWGIGALPAVPGIPPVSDVEAAAAAAMTGSGFVAAALALAGMLAGRRAHGPYVLGAGVVATALLTAGLMRGHHGGFVNVFMPMHWVLAAAFTLFLGDLVLRAPGWRGTTAAALLASAQLGLQVSRMDLARLEPTPEDVAAGDAVVEALRGVKGPVLSPFAPWLPAQAGHAPGVHLIALWDIQHPEGPFAGRAREVGRAAAGHRWGAVLDAEPSMGFGVPRHYRAERDFRLPRGVLLPRTGWRRRPEVLRVPDDAGPAAAREDVQ